VRNSVSCGAVVFANESAEPVGSVRFDSGQLDVD
jgi:hypothetical protein